MLVQITSSYFCAGIILENGICIEAAPIVKYMKGWDRPKIRDYCKYKKWSAKIIDHEDEKKK